MNGPSEPCRTSRSASWIIHPSLRPHNVLRRVFSLPLSVKLSFSFLFLWLNIKQVAFFFYFSGGQSCFQAGLLSARSPSVSLKWTREPLSPKFIRERPVVRARRVFVRRWRPLNKCLINSSGGHFVSSNQGPLSLLPYWRKSKRQQMLTFGALNIFDQQINIFGTI